MTKVRNLLNLAEEYGLWRATIYDIRKNREKIGSFVKNTDIGPSDRQTLTIELMDKNQQHTFMYVK
jgi:hypothetical protein